MLEAREPSVRYLVDLPPAVVQQFDLLATAPEGVTRLRELVLELAIRGKLVPQDSKDEPAKALLDRIRVDREQLVAAGDIRSPKALHTIAPDEHPFALPTGWQFGRLGELILSIRSGGTPSKQNPEFWNGDIPWASVKDLGFGKPVASTQDSITAAGLQSGSVLAEAGSILICTRMGLGKIGEATIDLAINQDLKAIQLGVGLNKAYFINFFKTVSIVGSGVTVAGIKQDELLDFVVPLPPTAEQARIVARVDELMRLCDALEAKGRLEAEQHARLLSTLLGTLTDSHSPEELATNWQRVAAHFDLLLDRPEAVDALEQTVVDSAVAGGFSKESAGEEMLWRTVRFEEVLEELRYGTAVKCGYGRVGSPVLRIPNLQKGRIDVTDLKYGVLDDRERSTLSLRRGDLLIVRSNGSASLVGTLAVVDEVGEGFAFAGYLVRARVKQDQIDPRYMLLVSQSQDLRRQIEGPIRTTSGVKNINSTEISGLTFALPPLSEQHRIVARVTQLRRLCANLRQRLAASQATQARLADAIVESATLA